MKKLVGFFVIVIFIMAISFWSEVPFGRGPASDIGGYNCVRLLKIFEKEFNDVSIFSRLDELNGRYFRKLLEKFQSGGVNSKSNLVIFEEGVDLKGKQVIYPTAIAPKELMKSVQVHHYDKMLQDSDLGKHAGEVTLWIKKMQAGTGSSLERKLYLRDLLGIEIEKIKLGAKGTDLYVEVIDSLGQKQNISLAEVQILQAINMAKNGGLKAIELHDIVGPETQKSMARIWQKKSVIDPSKTYQQLVDDMSDVSLFGKSFQDHLPTIGADGEITYARVAPGGHGFFAVEALRAAYDKKLRPVGKNLIASIGNGEDLSSVPDKYMLGLLNREKIGIAMITTTKTGNDLKGGQIALTQGKNGSVFTTIMEKAQAETSGQLKLFEELGLREGDDIAFFNTNMALFNYDILVPKIEKLVNDVGEEKFLEIITPDLIKNVKKQIDPDGVERSYTQLEGVMGSVILNLDKFWRTKYGEPLVAFINVDEINRTRFFSPIKTAFDYFMQFRSDRFVLDPSTMQLINQRPGSLPSVRLVDDYYKELANVITAFDGVKIIDMDQLDIVGKVNLQNLILKGNIRIESDADDLIDLAAAFAKYQKNAKKSKSNILENVSIKLDKNGNIVSLLSF